MSGFPSRLTSAKAQVSLAPRSIVCLSKGISGGLPSVPESQGRAAAFFGSLGTTGYEPAWTADTGRGMMQDILLRFNRLLLGFLRSQRS